jgi:hypothetical protein
MTEPVIPSERRESAAIPSERREAAVIPSERREAAVIPSERSESRDLHPAPLAGDRLLGFT